ncbi:MAG TPA: four helix bundle protein [Candidatus Wolfebacteria bacterium]|nr:four helix bundle protein [Candidatus Wolfebacteria bacterium]
MDEKKFLKVENLSAYKIAFNLSNCVWDIISKWDSFSKNTIGIQWVRATDSISANIAEGFGRYTKRDKINFYRYSYGSAQESIDWVKKVKQRNLLKDEEYNYIINEFNKLPKEINSLIKFTNSRLTI